jgi:hypothetical protein
MAKTKNTEQPKALVAAPTDLMAMMARDAGSGMEGTDRDSYAIPFIRVLQQLSPQCTAGKTGYIKSAKPGMIINTVTGDLIDGEDGIMFVPCAYQRRFIQWGARASGAGFKGEHNPEDIAAKISSGELVKSPDDGRIYYEGKTNPKKDDYFADTRSHFGLVLTDAGPVQALLSLTGSQIKKSKQLMGILSAVRIKGATPPTWMSKIHITTVAESNDQGSWHGVRVEHAGFIDSAEVYEAGKIFHDMIVAGQAKADYHDPDQTAPAGDAF